MSSPETYRTQSKKWRDEISAELLGRVCTSSSRFQDNLFDSNAIPPYEAGLKRSLDKIYEIIVYALFSALAEAMNLQVKISADESKSALLYEFGDFAEKVMRLNPSCFSRSEPARIYRVIIVCRNAERNIIFLLLTQIGWRSHIQSIITENELVSWYDKALRGKYSAMTGEKLLSFLQAEIAGEFPASKNIPDILRVRQYNMKGV